MYEWGFLLKKKNVILGENLLGLRALKRNGDISVVSTIFFFFFESVDLV